jgi:pyruvate,water dikinase
MVIPQFRAFRMLADEGFRNIGVFPPMVTHAEQYRRWRGIADSEGLRNVRFGLMVETPRAALAIRDFIPMIEFVVFGTNDLTQFLVATDRGNPLVASLFDETDPVVLDVIRSTAGACEEAGVETCVGGQIASSPKHLPSILAAGLTGVSVNPDPFTVAEIRRVVAAAESRA